MTLFLLLALSHLTGDYPLQTNWVYFRKTKGLVGGLWHASILTLCYLFFLAPYLADDRVKLGIAIIMLIHYFQDYLKIRFYDDPHKPAFAGYITDQILHLLAFGAVGLSAANFANLQIYSGSWVEFWNQPTFALYLILLILVTFFWEVTRYVYYRHRGTDKTLRKNLRGMFMRGSAITLIFWSVYFIWLN